MLNDQSLLENLFGHTTGKDNPPFSADSAMSLRDRVRMAKDMHQNTYPYNAGEKYYMPVE